MELIVKIKKKLNNFVLDVDFETHGEHLGILGVSGCGKSMTLKCIAGIEKPDEGYICLNGRVLYDSRNKINLPIQKRRVGYCFQNYALFPTMNVEENIKISNPKQEEVDKWVKLLHLEDLLTHRIQECSGGQQQRVALARLFVGEPELILLDEPFSALDYNLKENVYFDLKEIFDSIGQQMIMVSHDRNEIQIFCDKAVVLDDGKQVEMGEIHTLFLSPKSKAGALLIGEKNIYPYCCEKLGIYIPSLDLHLPLIRESDGWICIPFKALVDSDKGISCANVCYLKNLVRISVGSGYIYAKECHGSYLEIIPSECLFLK